MVTYVAHHGGGTGLYEIDHKLNIRKHPESVVGTFANRLIHHESDSIIIGPHIIDNHGNVRTIPIIKDYRLTSTMEHLTDPANKVYFLTMEGPMFEVDLNTFHVEKMFDLTETLDISVPFGDPSAVGSIGADPKRKTIPKPHFKAAHTGQGRLVVANNTFDLNDHAGIDKAGRLAEWDGKTWRILDTGAFNEVTGRRNWHEVIYATGWDKASAILMACIKGQWQKYRFPKASHTFEQFCQTEWPRIREVETERYLMNASGMFYELSPVAFAGRVWGVKPISANIRVISDFCCWKGMLVMGANQTSPIWHGNMVTGYPESNLWFGKPDDLWQWGKPAGWGGPWWNQQVKAGEPSDPYLMTGFDKKGLHLANESSDEASFKVEVDFLGDGSWKEFETVKVNGNGYKHIEFPQGFSAHWARVTSNADCKATAYFMYT